MCNLLIHCTRCCIMTELGALGLMSVVTSVRDVLRQTVASAGEREEAIAIVL